MNSSLAIKYGLFVPQYLIILTLIMRSWKNRYSQHYRQVDLFWLCLSCCFFPSTFSPSLCLFFLSFLLYNYQMEKLFFFLKHCRKVRSSLTTILSHSLFHLHRGSHSNTGVHPSTQTFMFLHFFFIKTVLQGSLKVAGKLKGKYKDFSHTLHPHNSILFERFIPELALPNHTCVMYN